MALYAASLFEARLDRFIAAASSARREIIGATNYGPNLNGQYRVSGDLRWFNDCSEHAKAKAIDQRTSREVHDKAEGNQ
jgi:hypothetical protein